MSRVPMFTPSSLPLKNGMGYYESPGIRVRYQQPFSQFSGAERLARTHGITKEAMDEYAFLSHQRAITAARDGRFKEEILAVEARGADGLCSGIHADDEGIRFDVTREGIAGVKLLQEGGLISAATASQICDGASGVMVVSEKALKRLRVAPLARIHHMTMIGHDPVVMLEAPLPATIAALKKAGMTIGDIDLYEVNEAFAPVPLAWLKATGADPERLNVHGGAIALGHPLGASGTKLMTTMLGALKQRNQRFGLQTMCEGGGMANVTIVERL